MFPIVIAVSTFIIFYRALFKFKRGHELIHKVRSKVTL